MNSPLARIWARGKGTRKRRSVPSSSAPAAASSSGPVAAALSAEQSAEVEKLKEEVKAVRESQLRMEEMLAKMLSGSSS